MGDAAAFSYISMAQAIADSGLSDEQVSNERTGLIVGSGGGSSKYQVEAADILREKGVKRVGPYMVPRTIAAPLQLALQRRLKSKVLTILLAQHARRLRTVLAMRLNKFSWVNKTSSSLVAVKNCTGRWRWSLMPWAH